MQIHRLSRQGFTLVELSIVLVIIGLLVGGILIAQSMIESAKISAQVKQIQQYDAAIITYVERFKNLPGDNPLLGTDGGNGNKLIESRPNHGGPTATDSGMAGTAYSCETEKFWKHLFPQQFVSNGTCSRHPTNWYSFPATGAAQAVSKGATTNAPAAKTGKDGSFIIVTPQTHDSGWVSTTPGNPWYKGMANFYVILDPSHAQNAPNYNINSIDVNPAVTPPNASTKPITLLALDKKMDDGIANQGHVQPGIKEQYGHVRIISNFYSIVNCSNGALYTVNNNNYTCTPFIRIGAQVGNGL